MTPPRDRRSYAFAPPRSRTGRRPIAQVLKNEHIAPDDDTDLFFALPIQGRRAVLDTLKDRSLS